MTDTLNNTQPAFESELAQCKTGAQQAKCYAKLMGVELTTEQLNKALHKFGTSLTSMEDCVKYALEL
jgi:hypothetical protein